MTCPFCGTEMELGRIVAQGYPTVWRSMDKPLRMPFLNPLGLRHLRDHKVTRRSDRPAELCPECNALVVPPVLDD